MVDKKQVEQLRASMIEIMDVIHKSCMDNGIQYYIIAGTALGAVRHKGFIPWDTDIDVAMSRKDYNRFIALSEKILPNGFSCLHFGNQVEWYHPHALVCKKDTMIHWNRSYYVNKIDCPVYVDIFALDNFPNDLTERERFERQMNRKLYLLSRRECVLYQHNTRVQVAEKKLFSKINKTICPNERFNQKLDQSMAKYREQECDIFGIIPSRYGFKREGINRAIIGVPQLYEFEGRKYYSYEKMDEYLTQVYGDYMKYPPIEKQKENFDLIDHIDF